LELIRAIASFLGAIFGFFCARQLVDELKAWTPWIIKRLIGLSVARLPGNRRERFEEEWKSHINDIPGDVGKIIVALGFLVAAMKIAAMDRAPQARIHLRRLLQRSFAPTIGAVGLILSLPLMLLIAVSLRLSGMASVLVRPTYPNSNEERPGIHLYRFAGNSSAIGRFLHKYHLNELPGLVNMTKGEIELTPREVHEYLRKRLTGQ
jgi:hypothetical protein